MFGTTHGTKKLVTATVFFCLTGWVYSGPVIGAPPAASATPAIGAPANVPADEAQAVAVSSLGAIDLHVKELDLSKVLQLLSIQAQRNIVASRNVAGTVTADLYGVDFYEALDAILHPNGFGYQEKGDFIYVYTQQELVAIQDAERKPVSQIVRLNYITATDASTFVTPLLSQAGSIAISGAAAPGFEASSGDGGANNYANTETLVIRDYPENIEEIAKVIQELDVRPKQVLLQATILEAKLTEENALGVDASVLVDFKAAEFATPLGAVNQLLEGTGPGPSGGAGTSTVGNTASDKAGLKIGIVNDDFSVFIRALDQVTDTTVLANPKLLVLNRQRAKLLVGQKIGYVSTTATDTSSTQTVEFLDTGTQLSVRPFVSDDDFIRLEIKPSISTGAVRELANFVIPETTNEELTTNVMVRNGQTVVLGGLFKETTTVTRNQLPFLGDIPVLGYAFRGQDDNVTRNEYIFMVTPTIVKDETLYAAGERAKDSVDLAQLGARESLLPWSRSKMTAGHVRDAMRYMQAGRKDKALWSANMALYLDKTSWEARRIKEELTGQAMTNPQRSVLNDAVDAAIERQLKDESSAAPQTQPSEQAADVAATEAEKPAAEMPAADAAEIGEFSTSSEPVAAANMPARVTRVAPEPELPAEQPVMAPVIDETAQAPQPVQFIEPPVQWTEPAQQAAADDATVVPVADDAATQPVEIPQAPQTQPQDEVAMGDAQVPSTQPAASPNVIGARNDQVTPEPSSADQMTGVQATSE
jgi:type IV pilus assembly protein PilQ